ncbi:sulfatase [Flammeovirgaceae bacterium SG7u.111]|nr:sulfatase [Flammeovirgaceae bacterium SG7u.132]WPO36994.1 sulfatase [Flammeovirgaceae bacterium SG7u.111]
MKRMITLTFNLLLISLFVACQPNEKADNRPNILWIVADDLGTDLGCYGEELVHTPNLDGLAAESQKYTNFFTVSAVCSPSRSTLITGMYPQSINSHQHRTQFRSPLPGHVAPVTHHFREAGYFTCNASFENWDKPGKEDYNFFADSLFDGTNWNQRTEGQPFFAQIQIHYPHRDFKRDPTHPVDPAKVKVPPYYPDHPVSRQDWALYLEFIQLLDVEVGKVLQKLEEDGLAENTIVFFFGDQGRPHVRAKQFMYDGGIQTPLMIRFPDKAKAGTVEPNVTSNLDLAATALNLAGIAVPDYMQGKPFLGENAQPRKYVFSGRDRRDETVDRIRAVRSNQFKYIRNFYPEKPYTQFNFYKKHAYPVLTLMQVLHKRGELTPDQAKFMAETKPYEELYDIQNDPWELNNLAEDSAYAEKMVEMRAQLDIWLEESDKGKYPEAPKEIEFAQQHAKEFFPIQMKNKRGLAADISDEEFLEYWEKVLTPTVKEISLD